MTRLFRPPQPLVVACSSDGLPCRVKAGGKARQVTAVTETWTQHALPDGRSPDRTFYRVIVDGRAPWDIYHTPDGDWYLLRIIT